MTSLFKTLFLWFVLFGQVSVKAALYFSPDQCWQNPQKDQACQFANNKSEPQVIHADIELVADKSGKGELSDSTLFLLPGRYWVSSAKELTIQTRHGNFTGKDFSVLVEIERVGVRCHVVAGKIFVKEDTKSVVFGQSVRYDQDSQDVFTIAKDELLENWKEILSLSKNFVSQKKDFVQAWVNETKILAQSYKAQVQRGIAAAEEKERQKQLAIKREQEAAKERRRLFREKNYLD